MHTQLCLGELAAMHEIYGVRHFSSAYGHITVHLSIILANSGWTLQL